MVLKIIFVFILLDKLKDREMKKGTERPLTAGSLPRNPGLGKVTQASQERDHPGHIATSLECFVGNQTPREELGLEPRHSFFFFFN